MRYRSVEASAIDQFAGMSDFSTADRADVRGRHGYDGGGLAVERRELDLERLCVLVGVNDGPDVAAPTRPS